MASPRDFDRIGQMAYCTRGRLGTVTRITRDKKGRTVFHGFTTAGDNWQTVAPTWVKK